MRANFHFAVGLAVVMLLVAFLLLGPAWSDIITSPVLEKEEEEETEREQRELVVIAPALVESAPPVEPAPPPAEEPPMQVAGKPEEAGETDPDEEAKAQLDELLATGGELVEEGLSLPKLVVRWNLAEIDGLVRSRMGCAVAEIGGALYRLVPGASGSFLDATRWYVIGRQSKTGMSNRAIVLSSGRWSAPRLAGLERRLRRALGGKPVILVFPSSRVDRYFAAKQCGAVESLGIDLGSESEVVTFGEFRFAERRAALLIDRVRVGSKVFTWKDPEAYTLRRR